MSKGLAGDGHPHKQTSDGRPSHPGTQARYLSLSTTHSTPWTYCVLIMRRRSDFSYQIPFTCQGISGRPFPRSFSVAIICRPPLLALDFSRPRSSNSELTRSPERIVLTLAENSGRANQLQGGGRGDFPESTELL